MPLTYKQLVQVGDIVSVLIRSEGRFTTDIQAEVVGVRADYSNPDKRSVKLAGIDTWIELDDSVEIGRV